jgi:hypothetical protein
MWLCPRLCGLLCCIERLDRSNCWFHFILEIGCAVTMSCAFSSDFGGPMVSVPFQYDNTTYQSSYFLLFVDDIQSLTLSSVLLFFTVHFGEE